MRKSDNKTILHETNNFKCIPNVIFSNKMLCIIVFHQKVCLSMNYNKMIKKIIFDK